MEGRPEREHAISLIRLLKRLTRPHTRIAARCRAAVRGGRGLEIGGPSRIFAARGRLPVYPVIRELDAVDFRTDTVWREGPAPENLLVAEAARLDGVDDAHYDCVLASHVLEHLANPLLALGEWRRIMRPDGALVLVVPHGAGTFDHRRPVTELAHLVEDLERETGEDDLTHLDEVLRLHDLERDPDAGSREAFEARCRRNPDNRCLHHHVFDAELVLRALDRAGWEIGGAEVMEPFHVAVLARRPSEVGAREPAPRAANAVFLADDATWRQRSPFPADRRPGA